MYIALTSILKGLLPFWPEQSLNIGHKLFRLDPTRRESHHSDIYHRLVQLLKNRTLRVQLVTSRAPVLQIFSF
jgi:hypothetical protein